MVKDRYTDFYRHTTAHIWRAYFARIRKGVSPENEIAAEQHLFCDQYFQNLQNEDKRIISNFFSGKEKAGRYLDWFAEEHNISKSHCWEVVTHAEKVIAQKMRIIPEKE